MRWINTGWNGWWLPISTSTTAMARKPSLPRNHSCALPVPTELLPFLDAFTPQLVLISAGFDGHQRDPLANLQLDANDYAWITRELVVIANRHCGGRVVSMLEGGYDLTALAECSVAHVDSLRW